MATDSKVQIPYLILKTVFTYIMTENSHIFFNIHIKMLYKTAFGHEISLVRVWPQKTLSENCCFMLFKKESKIILLSLTTAK